MNKKTGIIIGAAILLLLLGGAVVLGMRKSNPQGNANPSSQPTPTSNTTSGTLEDSLKGLLTSGNSVKCSLENTTSADTKLSGTIYVTKGKLRGDMTTTVGSNVVNSHIIDDTQTLYMWTDMTKSGFKFAINDTQTANANSKFPSLTQTVNYSCSNWTADESIFNLPTDITFTSYTIPAAPGANATGAGMSQCSICSSLPAEAQSACKTQYNCK